MIESCEDSTIDARKYLSMFFGRIYTPFAWSAGRKCENTPLDQRLRYASV
jgi:hypothetical protein